MTLLSLLSYWECPQCHGKTQFTKRQIENGIDECPKCGWASDERKDRMNKFAKMMNDLPSTNQLVDLHTIPRIIPAKKDMTGIIKFLDEYFGRTPTESECLRFAMFLESFESTPTLVECRDFLVLLKRNEP